MEALHIQRVRRRRKVEEEKDDKSEAYTEALKEEEEAIKIFSKVNIEFSRYRALNHVFMGTYVSRSVVFNAFCWIYAYTSIHTYTASLLIAETET